MCCSNQSNTIHTKILPSYDETDILVTGTLLKIVRFGKWKIFWSLRFDETILTVTLVDFSVCLLTFSMMPTKPSSFSWKNTNRIFTGYFILQKSNCFQVVPLFYSQKYMECYGYCTTKHHMSWQWNGMVENGKSNQEVAG